MRDLVCEVWDLLRFGQNIYKNIKQNGLDCEMWVFRWH